MKKILSAILALALCFTTFSAPAMAMELPNETKSNTIVSAMEEARATINGFTLILSNPVTTCTLNRSYQNKQYTLTTVNSSTTDCATIKMKNTSTNRYYYLSMDAGTHSGAMGVTVPQGTYEVSIASSNCSVVYVECTFY